MAALGLEHGAALTHLGDLDLSTPARPELDALGELVHACTVDPPPPAEQLRLVRGFLAPILRRRYDAPEPRLRDLEQLEQLAAGFPTRERFVTDLTLDPPISTSDLAGPPLLDEDYLVLSTVHSAKGGEWDVVHVIHAADGMFPSDLATGDDDQIEEERRLFYVALTRARDHLEVYFPLRYHRRSGGREDRHWYAQLTRFLPAEVRAHFRTETTYADRTDEGSIVAATPGTTEAVDALLASLFACE
jgi:DNA helicase-2/ATP-dependent DNA helicase PcrA